VQAFNKSLISFHHLFQAGRRNSNVTRFDGCVAQILHEYSLKLNPNADFMKRQSANLDHSFLYIYVLEKRIHPLTSTSACVLSKISQEECSSPVLNP
jgi:hypothetical protein